MRRLSLRGRRVVNVLRISWIIAVLWYELGVFRHAVQRCDWPVVQPNSGKATHILVVADPQILDHRSYPDRSAFLTWLSRVFTDLNLRKSWYFTADKDPDAVLFLGDMMDNGRYAMQDSEYEEYYQRFKNIFNIGPSIPVHYIPGNHDTGLGTSSTFSTEANTRYTSHFGDLNSAFSIAGHTFVLIDAPSLADEDSTRNSRGVSYEQWTPIPNGPVEFVRRWTKEQHRQPVILLTHIPLARSAGADCGPLRERGSINRGFGHGYQNTLGKQASSFLLESLAPSLVLSGDDHDYCEYIHDVTLDGRSTTVKEVTVKSFSMAMGIKQPGFQLLSLSSTGIGSSKPTFADKPCLLPDQLGVYLHAYVPLIFVSLAILISANLYRRRTLGQYVPLDVALEDLDTSSSSGSFSTRLRSRTDNDGSSLPLPNNSSTPRPPPARLRRHHNSFFRDLRDVAVYPLTLFAIITWFMFMDHSTDLER